MTNFINIKINGINANDIIEDFSFSNDLNAIPIINVNPADVDNNLFDIGNTIELYDNANVKFLEGIIKDITENWTNGINTKSIKITVFDLKSKIISADFNDQTGLNNIEALQEICDQNNILLETSITNANKYCMEKTINNQLFWNYVEEICNSEGWGYYVNHNKLFVKDIINDSNFIIPNNNIDNITHNYSDIKTYGNISIKGKINKDRLVSNDNPYTDILEFYSLNTFETISYNANNEDELYSILLTDNKVSIDEENEKLSFTFLSDDFSIIMNTIDNNTFEFTNNSNNFVITDVEKIPYFKSDKIGEQIRQVLITGNVSNPDNPISIDIKLKGKKIKSYSNDLTPDTLLAIYKDSNGNEYSKNNFLYYENGNISNLDQIKTILSSIARETNRRVLKINMKLKTLYHYNLLDRIKIINLNPNFNGSWIVTKYFCRRNARLQEWSLELIRSNTAIIPKLNIYKDQGLFTDENKLKYSGIISNVDDEKPDVFIIKLKRTVTANNINNYNIERGLNCIIEKTGYNGVWNIISIDEKDYNNNLDKINSFSGDTTPMKNYNGGYDSNFENDWQNSFNSIPNIIPYNEINGTMNLNSIISHDLGNNVYSIVLHYDNEIDPSSIDLTSYLIFPK